MGERKFGLEVKVLDTNNGARSVGRTWEKWVNESWWKETWSFKWLKPCDADKDLQKKKNEEGDEDEDNEEDGYCKMKIKTKKMKMSKKMKMLKKM